MIDACYTMKCDRCHRYLMTESNVVAEAGEEGLLIEWARKAGWHIGEFDGGNDFCLHCKPVATPAEESPNARD